MVLDWWFLFFSFLSFCCCFKLELWLPSCCFIFCSGTLPTGWRPGYFAHLSWLFLNTFVFFKACWCYCGFSELLIMRINSCFPVLDSKNLFIQWYQRCLVVLFVWEPLSQAEDKWGSIFVYIYVCVGYATKSMKTDTLFAIFNKTRDYIYINIYINNIWKKRKCNFLHS